MTDLIQCQDELARFCQSALRAPWLGLDTEFERVRTYYPRLCLLQLSTLERTVCVDPLQGLDLDPLAQLIANSPITILHAARQDLEVLQYALQVSPQRVFDTQIAAALLGHGEQVGYASLAKALCGVDLAKQQTRSDWTRRPLSDAQISYALDDARYLGSFYEHFFKELDSRQRLGWVIEDCAALVQRDLLREAADSAVMRTHARSRRLTHEQQSVVLALARWRERTAQEINLPRGWVLTDSAVLDIAREMPGNANALGSIEGVSSKLGARWGEVLMGVIDDGRRNKNKIKPLLVEVRPARETKQLADRLWAQLKSRCADEGIATSAVARREQMIALASGQDSVALLSGWRGRFIGCEFKHFCDDVLSHRSC